MSTDPAPTPDSDDQEDEARHGASVRDPALVAALCGWSATLRYGLLRLTTGWTTLVLTSASLADAIASRITGR